MTQDISPVAKSSSSGPMSRKVQSKHTPTPICRQTPHPTPQRDHHSNTSAFISNRLANDATFQLVRQRAIASSAHSESLLGGTQRSSGVRQRAASTECTPSPKRNAIKSSAIHKMRWSDSVAVRMKKCRIGDTLQVNGLSATPRCPLKAQYACRGNPNSSSRLFAPRSCGHSTNRG